MITQTKKAFSLAEILISLAIISVIATMGFTIAKKNIESAYDMYFYTGYTGLYNAIADANDKGLDYSKLHINSSEIVKHIKDLFNKKVEDSSSSSSSTTTVITAPNHIKYTITRISSNPYTAKIKMQVPSVKTKNSSNKEVTIYYIPEKYNFLIPADDTDTTTTTGDYATKRIDLFPFYIDDGIYGKSIQHCTDNTCDKLIDTPEYTKRKYYTFKAAFCKVYPGEALKAGTTNLFTCSSGTADKGALKLANPKKVF